MQFVIPFIKTAGTVSGTLPNVDLITEEVQNDDNYTQKIIDQNDPLASPSQSDSSHIQHSSVTTESQATVARGWFRHRQVQSRLIIVKKIIKTHQVRLINVLMIT